MAPPTRLCPDVPLPEAAFVPGHTPRPREGWLEARIGAVDSIDLEDVPASRAFRYGVDLYHAGFLWEAHEAWEGLWQLARKREELEPEATALRALIQLAAAALQTRMGRAQGAQRLRRRALESFETLARSRQLALGIELDSLVRAVRAWGPGEGDDPPRLPRPE
jgi:hypothetical protein